MENYDFRKSVFCRAMMTGEFVGFVSTIIALVYNIFYRDETGYLPADIINVSSLIFAMNLIFWVIGIIYYFFLVSFKKGDLIYLILFAIAILYFLIKTFSVHRSSDHLVNNEFKGLLIGILIIMGIGTLIIPLLFHNKKFEEYVL